MLDQFTFLNGSKPHSSADSSLTTQLNVLLVSAFRRLQTQKRQHYSAAVLDSEDNSSDKL